CKGQWLVRKQIGFPSGCELRVKWLVWSCKGKCCLRWYDYKNLRGLMCQDAAPGAQTNQLTPIDAAVRLLVEFAFDDGVKGFRQQLSAVCLFQVVEPVGGFIIAEIAGFKHAHGKSPTDSKSLCRTVRFSPAACVPRQHRRGKLRSTTGFSLPEKMCFITSWNSPCVPIKEPKNESWRANRKRMSKLASGPVVAPQVTSLPPGFMHFMLSGQVAFPTCSKMMSHMALLVIFFTSSEIFC